MSRTVNARGLPLSICVILVNAAMAAEREGWQQGPAKRGRTSRALLFLACVPLLLGSLAGSAWAGTAESAIKAAGIEAGLCVHLGVTDGKFTVDLAGGGKFVVHGLAADAASVDRARAHIASKGFYGPVSVERSSFKKLPYAENLVNLVVAEDLPALLGKGLDIKEVARVLTPKGAFCFKGTIGAGKLTAAGLEAAKTSGGWSVVVKPRPKGMGDWPNITCGPEANGNTVSKDIVLGPPGSLRWLTGPYGQGRSCPLISYEGMHICLLGDREKGDSSTKPRRPALMARNGYNGLPIWKHDIDWFSHYPVLASGRGRIFTINKGQITSLDAKTGKGLKTYGPIGKDFGYFLVKDNSLIVIARDKIRCFDIESCAEKWNFTIVPRSKTLVGDNQVYVFMRGKYVCRSLDLETGKEVWKSDYSAWATPKTALLLAQKDLLIFDDKSAKGKIVVHAVSPLDGRYLWKHDYTYRAKSPGPWQVFCIKGLVWLRKSANKEFEGLDPKTGKTKKSISFTNSAGRGCNPYEFATERFFVFSRPADFVEIETGKHFPFHAARHSCGPATALGNGLYYTVPNFCGCTRAAIHGFTAYATRRDPEPGAQESVRLEKGKAFGRELLPGPPGSSWPTFRHDAGRSSSTTESISNPLALLWEKQITQEKKAPPLILEDWASNPESKGLTPPVIADGRVFVGIPDEHQVCALDGKTGKALWSYTIGGRLNAPPTIYRNLCLVGSHDGWVYCLGRDDGKLIWRFRAAPEDRRIIAHGQLESPWPVTGGVAIKNDMVFVCVGRSSAMAGGVKIYALDPLTGKVKWKSDCKKFNGSADALVASEKFVSIGGNYGVHLSTGAPRGGYLSLQEGFRSPGLSRFIGLRPQYYFNSYYRSRFVVQKINGGKNRARTHHGALIAFNESLSVDYVFSARHRKREAVSKFIARNMDATEKWTASLPGTSTVDAMLLTKDHVVASVLPNCISGAPGDGPGEIMMLDVKDGKNVATIKLKGIVVPEGLAVANQRLYAATTDGKLLCFGK